MKPIENVTGIRGVKSGRYPLNGVCAHPECDRTDVTAHHIFPRGTIGNSLWFVEITSRPGEEGEAVEILPHVIGLCGHGTTGHHGDVEEHRTWIKLEEGGEFVWYEKIKPDTPGMPGDAGNLSESAWQRIGPLNPQPGSREGKPKRRRAKKDSAKLRETWSVKVPKDETEDGAEVLDRGFEDAAAIISREGADTSRSKYYVLADIFEWVRQHGMVAGH